MLYWAMELINQRTKIMEQQNDVLRSLVTETIAAAFRQIGGGLKAQEDVRLDS